MENNNKISEVLNQIEAKRLEQEFSRSLKEIKELQDLKQLKIEETLERLEEGMNRHESRSMKVQEEIKSDLKEVKAKLMHYDTRFAKLDTLEDIAGSFLRYLAAPMFIGVVLLVMKIFSPGGQ